MGAESGIMNLVGGVELGGTKTRVARGTPDGMILESETFPTGAPEPTFARILSFFRAGPSVSALGIGAFGPVAINPADADYARLRSTPKPGWHGFDIGAALRPLGVPFRLDTDVGAAGFAETRLGALRGLDSGIYLTVGTGIGGALMLGGRPVHGASHAEMGHVSVLRRAGDTMPSVCPYHGDCAEGLASGPAVQRRFGATLSELPADHPGQTLVTGYLGQLAAGLVLFAAPGRIVIGGGVALAPGFHERVHAAMLASLNGYGCTQTVERPDFIAPAALGGDAGLAGSLLLASTASG